MLSVTYIQVIRDSHGPDHVYLNTPLPCGVFPYEGHQAFGACVARGSALTYIVNSGLWRGLVVDLLDVTEGINLAKDRPSQAGDGRHYYLVGTSGAIEIEVDQSAQKPQIWSIIPVTPGLTSVWSLYCDGDLVCEVSCGGPGTTPEIISPVSASPGSALTVEATAKRLVGEWGDFSDYGRVKSWLV